MKVAFLGGVKSGKSRLAEERVQTMTGAPKPYYLATTECWDEEMQLRIAEHQKRRGKNFETIEESLDLLGAVKRCDRPVLIECVSMWLNNMLFHNKNSADILPILEETLLQPQEMVLVLNEVGQGVIPDNPLARQFVDLSGRAGQLLGHYCDEVYFCVAGLKMKMK
ncbi:MAG: adenosylcobinamide kinase [Candidatus Parabeggiatoa sp. nov. 1]|nr:MAG: adenosylcobinamide kinase [Gammaproteobacteria bacterium]